MVIVDIGHAGEHPLLHAMVFGKKWLFNRGNGCAAENRKVGCVGKHRNDVKLILMACLGYRLAKGRALCHISIIAHTERCPQALPYELLMSLTAQEMVPVQSTIAAQFDPCPGCTVLRLGWFTRCARGKPSWAGW